MRRTGPQSSAHGYPGSTSVTPIPCHLPILPGTVALVSQSSESGTRDRLDPRRCLYAGGRPRRSLRCRAARVPAENHLLGHRRDYVDLAVREGLNPRTVDEQLVEVLDVDNLDGVDDVHDVYPVDL